MILLISVIHYIPDYVDVITRLCMTTCCGWEERWVTFQDPLWYPRQKRWARAPARGLLLRVAGSPKASLLRRDYHSVAQIPRVEATLRQILPIFVEYHVVPTVSDEAELHDLFQQRASSMSRCWTATFRRSHDHQSKRSAGSAFR